MNFSFCRIWTCEQRSILIISRGFTLRRFGSLPLRTDPNARDRGQPMRCDRRSGWRAASEFRPVATTTARGMLSIACRVSDFFYRCSAFTATLPTGLRPFLSRRSCDAASSGKAPKTAARSPLKRAFIGLRKRRKDCWRRPAAWHRQFFSRKRIQVKHFDCITVPKVTQICQQCMTRGPISLQTTAPARSHPTRAKHHPSVAAVKRQ